MFKFFFCFSVILLYFQICKNFGHGGTVKAFEWGTERRVEGKLEKIKLFLFSNESNDFGAGRVGVCRMVILFIRYHTNRKRDRSTLMNQH